ncbi:diacylglycerol/lipid kinase family protein [Bifidobacterium cuniculi]|uniref:Diacylglycerol kinase catalytic domain protein n=1 Tax=Bifidobacterium cuniculi TaxID=1688 RepID=A0A087ALY6_9BIFI|nr:diacylglycerol kinase family protein [Bifidobacterium cuniculi]KFI59786.1 diacylglycerol kinase catalytic domain protein [Bifidobacterium cuniculi]
MNTATVIILVSMVVLIAVIVVAIALIRIHMHRKRVQQLEQRRNDQVHYAFIVNPSKPSAAQTCTKIREFCRERGLGETMFIETQLDKDGRACTQEALERGADVVIAVGGDGTVRTVASALAGTGHAMGIVPIGTGNLFARNMGIPIDDVTAALTIAVSHGSHRVDVGRLQLLDRPDEDHGHAFLIIAGVGFDAVMIDDTDPNLKKNVSWLAYFVSGAKHLFAPKYHADVSITDGEGKPKTLRQLEFRTFMAGNCGQIPVFSLMPDASFNDGLLDFELIDTDGGLIGWANLFGDVVHQTITKKAEQSPLSAHSKIDQMQGRSAELVLDKPVLTQVDGDMLPETKHLKFTVDREALIVRVPLGE